MNVARGVSIANKQKAATKHPMMMNGSIAVTIIGAARTQVGVSPKSQDAKTMQNAVPWIAFVQLLKTQSPVAQASRGPRLTRMASV
jgi:hypothetical protein